jgi:hypothetical protein
MRVTCLSVRFTVFGLGTLVWLALSSACRSDDAEGDVSSFFQQRAELICKKNFECCTGVDLLSESPESCAASNRINDNDEALSSALQDGQASFDTKAAEDCFRAVTALDCGAWAEVISGEDPVACRGIIKGKRGSGESCTRDYECASLYCQKTPQVNVGVCAAKGAQGAPCALNLASCLEGLTCLDPGTGPVCALRKDEAAQCDRGRECASGYCKDSVCRPVCWADVLAQELFGK